MATSTWVQGKLECEPNQWKWLQLNWLKSTPWLGQGPVSLSSRPIALPNFSALVLPPSMAAPIDLDPESQHRQNWLCLMALLPNELVMQLRKCRNGPLDPTDDQLFPWGSLGPHRKLLDSQAMHASRLTTLETVTSRGTPSKRWKESLPTQRLCNCNGQVSLLPRAPLILPRLRAAAPVDVPSSFDLVVGGCKGFLVRPSTRSSTLYSMKHGSWQTSRNSSCSADAPPLASWSPIFLRTWPSRNGGQNKCYLPDDYRAIQGCFWGQQVFLLTILSPTTWLMAELDRQQGWRWHRLSAALGLRGMESAPSFCVEQWCHFGTFHFRCFLHSLHDVDVSMFLYRLAAFSASLFSHKIVCVKFHCFQKGGFSKWSVSSSLRWAPAERGRSPVHFASPQSEGLGLMALERQRERETKKTMPKPNHQKELGRVLF